MRVTSRESQVLNVAGDPLSYIAEVMLDGYISGSGQADLTQKSNALLTALRTPYQDLVFLQDSGSNSATLLLNAGSLGGVVCVEGPEFYEGGQGAEYATQRTFRATFRAEYPLSTSITKLVVWNESVEFIGTGGPKRVVLEALNTPPQEQLTFIQTACRAVQTGRAVGYLAYPPESIALPLWPDFLQSDTARVRIESPERRGKTSDRNFPLSWHFEFISAAPLVGLPRRWPTSI